MCARKALRVVLISLVSLINTIWVISAPAQTSTIPGQSYEIAGTVRNENFQRMENVRVELATPTGSPLNAMMTSANGQFEFAGLTNGEYIVRVAAAGYDPVKKGVTLSDSSRTGLDIAMSRPFNAGGSSGDTIVSVHELRVPRKAQEEFQKGLVLASAKSDYHGSILQFERAIKIFPNYYEAYSQEGNSYLLLHESVQAEAALRKSVELSSGKFSDALFLLSGLLNDSNRYAEAESFARQLCELNAASWEGPYEMARALTGLKRVEDAEKNAVKARDSNPDDPPVYLVLANIHILRHDYPALLNDLNTYLKIAPSGPAADQVRKTLAQVQAIQEEQNRAKQDAPDDETPGDEPALPDLPPPATGN